MTSLRLGREIDTGQRLPIEADVVDPVTPTLALTRAPANARGEIVFEEREARFVRIGSGLPARHTTLGVGRR